jgi:hypothetical protein
MLALITDAIRTHGVLRVVLKNIQGFCDITDILGEAGATLVENGRLNF